MESERELASLSLSLSRTLCAGEQLSLASSVVQPSLRRFSGEVVWVEAEVQSFVGRLESAWDSGKGVRRHHADSKGSKSSLAPRCSLLLSQSAPEFLWP